MDLLNQKANSKRKYNEVQLKIIYKRNGLKKTPRLIHELARNLISDSLAKSCLSEATKDIKKRKLISDSCGFLST